MDNFWVYGSPLGSPEGDGGRTEEILVSNIRCISVTKLLPINLITSLTQMWTYRWGNTIKIFSIHNISFTSDHCL